MAGAARIDMAGGVLTVAGVLDFDTVVTLQEQGREWIGASAPADFTLDLAGVQYSTSAGLALVLDWMRAAAASGKRLRLEGMPADMQALARVSGLDPVLPPA